MKHLSEEELIGFYYGEPEETGGDPAVHLAACETCRSSYQSLQLVLNSVDSLAVPERAADYEERVRAAVQSQLPRRMERSFGWNRSGWKQWLGGAAIAASLTAAFFAGHAWQHPTRRVVPLVTLAGVDSRESVLLGAVGDHLERSQLILMELANAQVENGHVDISGEQKIAAELLESNRLYRQTAIQTGDAGAALVLDDLERVLIEITHSPSSVPARDWNDLRLQIEDRGLLFKVRVVGSQIEQREQFGGKL